VTAGGREPLVEAVGCAIWPVRLGLTPASVLLTLISSMDGPPIWRSRPRSGWRLPELVGVWPQPQPRPQQHPEWADQRCYRRSSLLIEAFRGFNIRFGPILFSRSTPAQAEQLLPCCCRPCSPRLIAELSMLRGMSAPSPALAAAAPGSWALNNKAGSVEAGPHQCRPATAWNNVELEVADVAIGLPEACATPMPALAFDPARPQKGGGGPPPCRTRSAGHRG